MIFIYSAKCNSKFDHSSNNSITTKKKDVTSHHKGQRVNIFGGEMYKEYIQQSKYCSPSNFQIFKYKFDFNIYLPRNVHTQNFYFITQNCHPNIHFSKFIQINMVAPHSSQTKRAHELTRDKFVATVHKINSKKLTTKELFFVFKHVNGGKEAQCASLLMIRKVFNKKNPVAPSSKLAMLMERG